MIITHLGKIVKPSDLWPWISVWPFHSAPEAYRELSRHYGDEDWLAFVPAVYEGQFIPWLETGPFGCCSVSSHPVDGGTVYIGAHA